MRMRSLVGGVVLAAAAAACASGGGASPASTPAVKLEDTNWELVTIGGAPLPEGIKRPPSLKLEAAEGKVVGFAGCNRLFGAYSVDGPKLRLSPLGTTKMACVGPAMDLEKRFLEALERATSYSISGDTLTLSAGDQALATLHSVAATQ